MKKNENWKYITVLLGTLIFVVTILLRRKKKNKEHVHTIGEMEESL